MEKTDENLKDAFAGESQANRRYLAFAQKAEEEGLKQVAKLFRAAAEAETIHALNHLKRMEKIKSTEKNLQAAISGESYEFEEMYPEYLDTAKEEGKKQAAWSFDVANKVEEKHANLFSKMLEALRDKKEIEEVDYYVCNVCGNTVGETIPEKCPVCGAPRSKFFKVT